MMICCSSLSLKIEVCRDNDALSGVEVIEAQRPSKADWARMEDDADLALLMKATAKVLPKKEKHTEPELPVGP
jgi:hypothetical protein